MNYSMVKCQVDRVGIGVENCEEYISKSHYGKRFAHDGGYCLCDAHQEMLMNAFGRKLGGDKCHSTDGKQTQEKLM